MRSERGQATVEWIGVVLLVALALAALTRVAPRADREALANSLTHAITHPEAVRHAAKPQVVGIRSGKRTVPQPPGAEAFTAPPLVPVPTRMTPRSAPRSPGAGALLRWARRAAERGLPGGLADRVRVRRGAGAAWRRAWYACLIYERFRWAFLHPESRFPGYTMPPEEVLRIANDCVSPVDLVRDWPMLTGRAE